MMTAVVLAWVVVVTVLLLWGLFDGHGLGDDAHLLRTWHLLMTQDPPGPEELAAFVGPTVELVHVAAVDTLSAEPGAPLAAVVRQADSRSRSVSDMLFNWSIGVSQLDERFDTRRLQVTDLCLRRLRWLGSIERVLGFVSPVFRYRPATHLATLRWALRLLVGALRQAERARPERRARLLAAVAHDFEVVMRDAVESHGQVLGPFLRWRATLPALPPGGGRYKTPWGWWE